MVERGKSSQAACTEVFPKEIEKNDTINPKDGRSSNSGKVATEKY
jgi:hypothetical protein